MPPTSRARPTSAWIDPNAEIVAAADHDWHSAGVEQGSDRLGQPFVGGGGVLLQDFQVPGIRNQELVEVDARFHVEGAAEVLERSPDCRRPSGRSGAPAGLAHPLVERCAEQYGVGGLSPPRLDSMPQGGTIAGSYRENSLRDSTVCGARWAMAESRPGGVATIPGPAVEPGVLTSLCLAS